MKTLKALKNQKKDPDWVESADKCIALYNYLLKINDGRVSSHQWQVLTEVTWKGKGLNAQKMTKPSALGEAVLRGIAT